MKPTAHKTGILQHSDLGIDAAPAVHNADCFVPQAGDGLEAGAELSALELPSTVSQRRPAVAAGLGLCRSGTAVRLWQPLLVE